ncbi:CHASE2 domain-containing protein [Pseudomonadota bacterium]
MIKLNVREKFFPIILGLFLTALALYSYSSSGLLSQFMLRIEGVVYDFRYNATLPDVKAVDERIVIVSLDEKSLAEEGHWPWPRDKVAWMTDVIMESGAVVVGFDILFAEPQANSAEVIKQKLNKESDKLLVDRLGDLYSEFDYDNILADSFRGRDVVLGYTFHNQEAEQLRSLPPALATQDDLDWDINFIKSMPSYTASLPVLTDAAAATAFLTTFRDPDGILRRTPLIIRHDDSLYASFALEIAKTYFLLDEVEISTSLVGAQQVPDMISLGSIHIPVDEFGQAVIPYRGASPAFPYISASDVLSKNFSPTAFNNKIVIVGATALALGDVVATPVQSIYPGVEVHASLLSGILDAQFPEKPSWATGVNLVVTAVLGGALALLMPWLSPVLLVVVGGVVTGGLVGVNTWFWHEQNLVFQVVAPMILVLVLTIMNLAYGFLIEAKQRRQLKNVFGQYIPPQLVDIMSQTPDQSLSMESESRELTVLFADIRNFTAISEMLEPHELKVLLNQFFSHMTRQIFQHKGTIDKYVGDMVMAFWGAPVNHGPHAQPAVLAAIDMLARVEKLKPELNAQGLPEISIGIGLNTGVMSVGDMGCEYRRAYTVIGDSVNLASRLENLTKYYGVGIVISEFTLAKLDGIICRKLDRVQVKGKTSGVEVYEPICRERELSTSLKLELQQHNMALEHYWNQCWDEAQDIFEVLNDEHPNTEIYSLYLSRIKEIRHRDLGEDWDGVYERRGK